VASSAAQDRAARAAQASVAPDQAVAVQAALERHSVAVQGRGQVARALADLVLADRAIPFAAVQDQRVPTAQPNADHVLQDPAGPPAHPGHVQIGPRGARVDRPIHASSLSRSISRGAR
jgi:hypothetical protein